MTLPRNGVVQPVEGVNGGEPIPVIPTGSAPNKTAVNFKIVTVTDHAQGYAGPNVAIPDGYQVICSMRITQSTSETGYIAGAQADVLDPTKRKEFVKGFLAAFQVQNMNEIFFGASVDGTIWELYAEAS